MGQQSTHLWWLAVAKLQAASVQLRRGTDRRTDGWADRAVPKFPLGRGQNKMVTCLSFRSPHAVASWKPDGAEAINSDTEDGVDGTEAGRVVERQPEIAENFTHRPRLLRENVHRVQRH